MTGHTTRASDIAQYLGLPLAGPDLSIRRPASAAGAFPGAVVFLKEFAPDWAERLNAVGEVLVIATPEYAGALRTALIVTPSPRLAYARVLRQFFAEPRAAGIAESAVIAPDAVLGRRIAVGEFCHIGAGVSIGDETVLETGVVLYRGTSIGERCHVGAHSVIGAMGFGLEFEEGGAPIRIPHLGGVRIGADVEIGALVTIARGTLDCTIVEEGARIDDHVHIAHNASIGARAILTGSVEIAGSARIGPRAWLGPNATINTRVRVGEDALIAAGAVVSSDVEAGLVAAGNPARAVKRRAG